MPFSASPQQSPCQPEQHRFSWNTFLMIFLPPLVLVGGCFGMLYYAETKQEGSIADLLTYLFPALAQDPVILLALELTFLFLLLMAPTAVGSWLLVRSMGRQQRAEQQLRRMAMSVEAGGEAILITNCQGVIEYVNPAFSAMSGWSREEAVGQTSRFLNRGITPPSTFREMWAALKEGQPWSGRLQNRRKLPEGQEGRYWVQSTIAPVRDRRGHLLGYVGVERDITEQVRLEERRELERESAEARATISRILQEPNPLELRLRLVLIHLLSLKKLDLRNKGGLFLRPLHSQHLELMILEGEEPFPEAFRRHEDVVPLGYCLCGRAAQSLEVLVCDDYHTDPRHERRYEGMEEHGHYIVPLIHSGEAVGVMFLYTQPHPSHDPFKLVMLRMVGEMMGLAIADDRLKQEMRRNQEFIIQSEKMSSLGRLVAGVAHEINTPVGIGVTAATYFQEITDAIQKAYSGQTMKRSDLERYFDESRKTSDLILRNLMRTSELVGSFKMVSADQTSEEQRTFNLNAYLHDILLSLRPRLKKTPHQVVVQCPHDMEMNSYPGALAQVITNLVFNSLLHAFGEEQAGTMTITVEPQGEEWLILTYHDDGRGIPESHLRRVFDPFFTTRRGQGGTGLGLNIVFNLVHQTLKGRITCSSPPDDGATFRLELPRKV